MGLRDSINAAFQRKKDRGWEKIYVAIDLHGTICHSTYDADDTDWKFYPYADSALRFLTGCEDIAIILYTCSHEEDIAKYLEWMKGHEINFDWVNENPDCTNTDISCFDKKFYFNVLLDDKAGFVPETDWLVFMDVIRDRIRKESQKRD